LRRYVYENSRREKAGVGKEPIQVGISLGVSCPPRVCHIFLPAASGFITPNEYLGPSLKME
jgi:hypothetical protein